MDFKTMAITATLGGTILLVRSYVHWDFKSNRY